MSDDDRIERNLTLQGTGVEMFRCEALECLCDSGAGTGKTFSLLLKANWTARAYPRSRQLFLRKTRKSLNEAILRDWEEAVLWPGHPAITGTASFEHRDAYTYPNQAIIGLAGMDTPSRWLSTKWDRIYVFQAEELEERDINVLLSRLRNFGAGYHQLLMDCNPEQEDHPLNRRFPEDHGVVESNRVRLRYRHEDNPFLWDADRQEWTREGKEYVFVTLESLTGVDRERLLYHKWITAAGAVWPEFDKRRHLKTGRLCRVIGDHRVYADEDPDEYRRRGGYVHVEVAPEPGAAPEPPVRMKWCWAAQDWGYRPDPGCLLVFGMDGWGRVWVLREVYRCGQTRDWWAEQVDQANRDFKLQRVVCDPSEPEGIRIYNDRLGFGERDTDRIAIGANNQIVTGVELIRDHLVKDEILILRDLTGWYHGTQWVEGTDEERRAKKKPTGLVGEVPSYVYADAVDEKRRKDRQQKPDPKCECHGIDTLRYGSSYAWRKDLEDKAKGPQFKTGTMGDLMDHESVLERSKRWPG